MHLAFSKSCSTSNTLKMSRFKIELEPNHYRRPWGWVLDSVPFLIVWAKERKLTTTELSVCRNLSSFESYFRLHYFSSAHYCQQNIVSRRKTKFSGAPSQLLSFGCSNCNDDQSKVRIIDFTLFIFGMHTPCLRFSWCAIVSHRYWLPNYVIVMYEPRFRWIDCRALWNFEKRARMYVSLYRK